MRLTKIILLLSSLLKPGGYVTYSASNTPFASKLFDVPINEV